MNENGNMRLTIGSRYCVNVTVNQGERGVDHSVVYYSFISLMLAGNGKGGCRREEGAYNRILLTISAISSDPFFLFPLTSFSFIKCSITAKPLLAILLVSASLSSASCSLLT